MARTRQGKRARERAAVLHKLAPFKRPAWLPITEAGDGALEASKFCGTPYLERQDAWPVCPNCTEPMRFILQLNLSQVPDPCRGRFGQGLLQMFYCDNEREEDGSPPVSFWADRCDGFYGYRPFTKNRLVRLVEPMRGATVEEIVVPSYAASNFGGAVWAPRQIIGWQEVVDYPWYEELTEWNGFSFTDDEIEHLIWLEQHEQMRFIALGDKLGGWPFWTQEMSYPECPQCATPMALVFQLASEDNLPFAWGDNGTAHITQCPHHQEQLTFDWACY